MVKIRAKSPFKSKTNWMGMVLMIAGAIGSYNEEWGKVVSDNSELICLIVGGLAVAFRCEKESGPISLKNRDYRKTLVIDETMDDDW